MPKTKTSGKRQGFSIEDMPIVKLKKGVKTSKFNANKKMANKKFIANAIVQALELGEFEDVKEILLGHAEAVNITAVLKKANISKATFYQALSPKGNPSLKTFSKIYNALAKAG